MKRLLSVTLAVLLTAGASTLLVGCDDNPTQRSSTARAAAPRGDAKPSVANGDVADAKTPPVKAGGVDVAGPAAKAGPGDLAAPIARVRPGDTKFPAPLDPTIPVAAAGGGGGGGQVQKFSIAWSEYPSWSVFGVAQDIGLLADMEKKWGVSITLKLLDYNACITEYNAKTADAACLTNMDTLSSALSRKSVSIMPTSTSVGADALLVTGVKDVQELKRKKIEVQGLGESVSQYAFARILEKKYKMDASDFKYVNTDADKAAIAMQNKKAQAIMVWNPFVLQTEKQSKDVVRLFDTSEIPEEIIDMVIVGQDVLNKPGGDKFACAIIDTFYEFSKLLDTPARRDELLVALGKKFSSLNKDEMAICCTHTRFYKTPDAALKLFEGEQFPKTMDMITKFWVDQKWLKGTPKLGYGSFEKAKEADFRFDPTYIKMVKDKK